MIKTFSTVVPLLPLLDFSFTHELLHSMHFFNHQFDFLTVMISQCLPPLCVYYFFFTPSPQKEKINLYCLCFSPPSSLESCCVYLTRVQCLSKTSPFGTGLASGFAACSLLNISDLQSRRAPAVLDAALPDRQLEM